MHVLIDRFCAATELAQHITIDIEVNVHLGTALRARAPQAARQTWCHRLHGVLHLSHRRARRVGRADRTPFQFDVGALATGHGDLVRNRWYSERDFRSAQTAPTWFVRR